MIETKINESELTIDEIIHVSQFMWEVFGVECYFDADTKSLSFRI